MTWKRMPTNWIKGGTLKKLIWLGKEKSYYISALLIYLSILHECNSDNSDGVKISYDKFENTLGISRTQISHGIKILEEKQLISVDRDRRDSVYSIKNYLSGGEVWGKVPTGNIFKEGKLKNFTLRSGNELNALKLYFLIIAFRDNATNYASISYDKINDYVVIDRNKIRAAISKLVSLGLIHVDRKHGTKEESYNIYRVVGIDNYRNDYTRVN